MRYFQSCTLRLFVCLPSTPRGQQLRMHGWSECARQHHHPIFAALGFAHDDHVAVKIDIFDAQAHALHQPHTRAVEQPCQQSGRALHLGK